MNRSDAAKFLFHFSQTMGMTLGSPEKILVNQSPHIQECIRLLSQNSAESACSAKNTDIPLAELLPYDHTGIAVAKLIMDVFIDPRDIGKVDTPEGISIPYLNWIIHGKTLEYLAAPVWFVSANVDPNNPIQKATTSALKTIFAKRKANTRRDYASFGNAMRVGEVHWTLEKISKAVTGLQTQDAPKIASLFVSPIPCREGQALHVASNGDISNDVWQGFCEWLDWQVAQPPGAL